MDDTRQWSSSTPELQRGYLLLDFTPWKSASLVEKIGDKGGVGADVTFKPRRLVAIGVISFAEALTQFPFLQQDQRIHDNQPGGKDQVAGEIVSDQRITQQRQRHLDNNTSQRGRPGADAADYDSGAGRRCDGLELLRSDRNHSGV